MEEYSNEAPNESGTDVREATVSKMVDNDVRKLSIERNLVTSIRDVVRSSEPGIVIANDDASPFLVSMCTPIPMGMRWQLY